MIVPNAQAVPVEAQPAQAETEATHSEDAVTALAAIPTDSGAEGSALTTSMAASEKHMVMWSRKDSRQVKRRPR